jgi:hypothetical protein
MPLIAAGRTSPQILIGAHPNGAVAQNRPIPAGNKHPTISAERTLNEEVKPPTR